VLAVLARTPTGDDDFGFSRDPKEHQKIGSAGEREEIGRVRRELASKGFDTVYDSRDITRMRRNVAAGRPNRPPRTDEWLAEIFPDGRARPEIVAIDHNGKRILALDLTASASSGATAKPGDVSKLPADTPAGQQGIHHLDKTKGYGQQVARRLPPWYADYSVVAQDRYWTTGKYSVEVKIPNPPPAPSRADPTSGPPDNPMRKGPNFKPQPVDDRPKLPPPAPATGWTPPGGTRGGADTAAPAMEIEGGRVKLYRGVGPAEASQIMRYGDFSYSPHGGGKYFSFTKQDAVNAANVLYPDGATIVETSVPKAYVPQVPGEPMPVHHPHIPARGGPAVMVQGEVHIFYDPRAGGWSLHVDDSALDVMNSQKTRPKIHESSLPVIGTTPPRPSGAPGGAPEEPHPAPAERAPTAAAGEAETMAASSVKENFVPELAAEHNSRVIRPGRYAYVGGTLYAVIWVGGAFFLVHDLRQKGPIQTAKEWGISAVLTNAIATRAGVGLGTATIVLMLVFMPSDQGGDAERIGKADAIDGLIHTAFPDVVSDKRLFCSGHCTAGNRKILDVGRYYRLLPTVSALAEHAWHVEDDPRAVARLKRLDLLKEQHRREEERDLAERVKLDKELASYRAAIYRPVGFHVKTSVGEDGHNDPGDVKRVSKLLHELGFLDKESDDLELIGEAIYTYQASVLRLRKPDGRVDPRGKTESALRARRRISMALP
jgi:hypothetical protein